MIHDLCHLPAEALNIFITDRISMMTCSNFVWNLKHLTSTERTDQLQNPVRAMSETNIELYFSNSIFLTSGSKVGGQTARCHEELQIP